MAFDLPGCDGVRVRLFDKVETVDDTYRIRDIGLEYGDGSIDSIAVGGNFATLSNLTASKEAKKAVKKAKKAAKKAAEKAAKKAKKAKAPTPQNVEGGVLSQLREDSAA